MTVLVRPSTCVAWVNNMLTSLPSFVRADHGLFCISRAVNETNLKVARDSPNEALSLLKALESALADFEGEANLPFTSTCPHCSFTLASMLVNYLYWNGQRNLGTDSVPWHQGFFTSRPQEGYVWPLVEHIGRRSKHVMDESVNLNFVRGPIKDSVS